MRAASLPVEPYASPEGYGLLFELDGAGQPLRRCRQLAARARMRGARLHEDTPALDVSGDRVITPTGEVRCGAVIVAVDGSLEQVIPELAGRVRTARLQVLGTAPAIEVTIPRPVYARWGLDYWQQTPDKRVVLGGFRDLGGDSEWTARAEPSRPIQEQLTEFLRIGLGVTAPVTHRWAGCIAFTDDPLPILEEVRQRVWALGAYNGTGNVLGAIWGRAAAQRIVTGTCLLDGLLPGVARTG
jgi:glycine/D-amino acid oxidase-like deaminating enzyme